MNTETPLLSLSEVSVCYGEIEAVRKISFDLKKGEILSLIGANGAGKTTILKTISGLLRPKTGKIQFEGKNISQLDPSAIVNLGIGQAPEGRGIFLNLTVEENLDLGAWTSISKKEILEKELEHIFGYFPRLKERRKQNAGTLSGGEQQMLAIGRALMSKPRLLLLDEPSLGLAPQLIETIFEIVQKINREGVSVLLVEQNALQALQIAHQGVVLEAGELRIQGLAQSLLTSDEVKKAYLGQ